MNRTDTEPVSPAPQAPGGRAAARLHQDRFAQGPGRFGPPERIALALSAVWLLLVLALWLFLPAPAGPAGIGTVISVVVGAVLPLALIWIAAITARTVQDLRAEAAGMRAMIEALSPPPPARMAPASVPGPSVGRSTPAVGRQPAFASRRDGTATEPSADRRAALVRARPAPAGEAEPSLALGAPAGTPVPPLSNAEFIHALNFPDNAEDRDGFRALRRALEDHSAARLIRAAQDVLNLLSRIDIFMDDLSPDLARPELWRRFAQGERGREIAPVGGIRDRSVLAVCTAQMRSDTIFRDAVHHFLRHFDRTFATFEQSATDQDIAALANTRTARAFMLLGRVTGIFD